MVSLYDVVVPFINKALMSEIRLLDKARDFANEKGIPVSNLLELRVFPDMLPLRTQVICTCSSAKKVIAHLRGEVPTDLDDRQVELGQLITLLNKTCGQLAELDEEVVSGKETTITKSTLGPKTYQLSPLEYIQGYALPNVFFHLSMVYALLRGIGVPIGKQDYLWEFMSDFKEEEASASL